MRGQFRGYRNGEGRGAGLEGGDVRRLATGDRFLALAGRAVLHPRGQVPAGDLHGGPRPTAPAADDLHGFDLEPNYFRFRISPDVTIAIGANVIAPGTETTAARSPRWWRASIPRADEMDAYERVLGDAMRGRRHAVRPGGLRRGGVANRRSGAEGRARPSTNTSPAPGDQRKSTRESRRPAVGTTRRCD